MIIQKLRLFLAEIEAFVDHWGQSIVGDLENVGQAGPTFRDQLKKLASEKALKRTNYYNLCTKLSVCRKYQGKIIYLNMKVVLKKWTSDNFDLGCFLTLLLPSMGWDIMVYESDYFHSYTYLRNCSFKINFKYYINLRVTLPPFPHPDPSTTYPY